MIEMRILESVYRDENGALKTKDVLQYRKFKNGALDYLVAKNKHDMTPVEQRGAMGHPSQCMYASGWSEWMNIPRVTFEDLQRG